MKKGSRKSEVCRYIDFSPLVPDNPEPPICKMGHGWSSGCMKNNTCPDYKYSWGRTLESIKEEYGF